MLYSAVCSVEVSVSGAILSLEVLESILEGMLRVYGGRGYWKTHMV